MGGRRKRWTEARLREELLAFLDGRDEWPSQQAFKTSGHSALLSAVKRHGGVGHWAETLGLAPPRPGGQTLWSDERVRAELRAFVGKSDLFPSADEFVQAGQRPLRLAAIARGGLARWAEELGVPLRARGRPELWPEERIRRELAPFIGGGRWPTERELRQAGKMDLHAAIQRRGGAAAWARRCVPPVRRVGAQWPSQTSTDA